jgi:CDP-diacylglycerol---serine O-phosphatidyltransferase
VPLPRRPRSETPLVQLLPNLMTLAALVAGLTAMRLALLGRIEHAVMLILLAVVLDGLDGRLARALNSESELGAELDSLADFLNFGVAPAFVLFLSSFDPASGFGWIAMLSYSLCCVLRLAKFNIDARAEPDPTVPKPGGFSGVPSPAGAMLVMAPIYLAQVSPAAALPPFAVALLTVGVGAMMIVPLPTPSLKRIRVPRGAIRPLLLATTLIAAAVAVWPWETLLVLSVAYVARVLAGWAIHLRRERM